MPTKMEVTAKNTVTLTFKDSTEASEVYRLLEEMKLQVYMPSSDKEVIILPSSEIGGLGVYRSRNNELAINIRNVDHIQYADYDAYQDDQHSPLKVFCDILGVQYKQGLSKNCLKDGDLCFGAGGGLKLSTTLYFNTKLITPEVGSYVLLENSFSSISQVVSSDVEVLTESSSVDLDIKKPVQSEVSSSYVTLGNRVHSSVLQVTNTDSSIEKERSYADFSYTLTLATKGFSTGLDVAEFAYQPDAENALVLMRDYIHLDSIVRGGSWASLGLTALDVCKQVSEGKYSDALLNLAVVAVFMLPKHPMIPLVPAVYAGYELANKFYSFYSHYGTAEKDLKSNIAYGKIAYNLGFKGSAKAYFTNAKEIMQNDQLHLGHVFYDALGQDGMLIMDHII